jgi:hypothetical protein
MKPVSSWMLGLLPIIVLWTGCSEVPLPLEKEPTPTPRPTATPTPAPSPTPTPVPIPVSVPDPDRDRAQRFLEKARREALLQTQEAQQGIFESFPLIVPGQTVELSSSNGIEFSGTLVSTSEDFVQVAFQGRQRYVPTRELPHSQKLQLFQPLRQELVQLEASISAYQTLKDDPVYLGDHLAEYLTYNELLAIGHPQVLLQHAREREALGDITYSFFVYGFLARRELPGAVYELGRFYAQGIGMSPNYPRALTILRKARDLGAPEAASMIELLESVEYFEEAERDFRIETELVSQTCPRCKGSGELPRTIMGEPLSCTTCRGTGQIQKRILKKVPLD